MADLITVDLYKELQGIASTKEDAKLEIIIPSVSQLVKTYCANSIIDFYSVDKVETFNMEFETSSLQLTESPVNSVSLVEERSSYDGSYAVLTTSAKEYYLDTRTDSIFRTDGNGFKKWTTGPGAVRVTYRAGYATTPADLLLAVADLVTYYLRDEYKQRQTLSGASQENPQASRNVGFPDHIRRVLDLYRLVL
jgi:hypothetical protein